MATPPTLGKLIQNILAMLILKNAASLNNQNQRLTSHQPVHRMAAMINGGIASQARSGPASFRPAEGSRIPNSKQLPILPPPTGSS